MGLSITHDSDMSTKMESFIIDAIIVAKFKHSEDLIKMAISIKAKLENHYCGYWNVFVKTIGSETGYCIRKTSGTCIQVSDEDHRFTVFKSP